MTRRRTPNLFVLGAPKCGTTTMHQMLGSHPSVFMSTVKEPGYFNDDGSYAKGTNAYADLYFRGASAEHYVGESTPWYLYSDEAAERIERDCPGARYVVMVRNPVKRAWSHYWDQVSAQTEPRSYHEAVRDELDQQNEAGGMASIRRRYISSSDYGRHLERWMVPFREGRLLLVEVEKLWADPAGVRAQIAARLDLDPSLFAFEEAARANVGGAPRSKSLARLLFSPGHQRTRSLAARLVPDRLVRHVGQLLSDVNKSSSGVPAMPADLERCTWEALGDAVERLENLTGMTFEHWRTGGLDGS